MASKRELSFAKAIVDNQVFYEEVWKCNICLFCGSRRNKEGTKIRTKDDEKFKALIQHDKDCVVPIANQLLNKIKDK